jgi:hypothetical protein
MRSPCEEVRGAFAPQFARGSLGHTKDPSNVVAKWGRKYFLTSRWRKPVEQLHNCICLSTSFCGPT